MKKRFVLILTSICVFALLTVPEAQAQSLERDVQTLTHEIFKSMEKDVNPPAANQNQNKDVLEAFKKAGRIENAQIVISETSNNAKASQMACPAGYYCRNGFCISYWEGDACVSNDDCPGGQICIDGFCVVFTGIMCE